MLRSDERGPAVSQWALMIRPPCLLNLYWNSLTFGTKQVRYMAQECNPISLHRPVASTVPRGWSFEWHRPRHIWPVAPIVDGQKTWTPPISTYLQRHLKEIPASCMTDGYQWTIQHIKVNHGSHPITCRNNILPGVGFVAVAFSNPSVSLPPEKKGTWPVWKSSVSAPNVPAKEDLPAWLLYSTNSIYPKGIAF